MFEVSAYASLFMAALLAATILPMQSEAVLVGLLLSGTFSPALLLATASLGNILGSILNWILGRYINHLSHYRWFPIREHRLELARTRYRRYGRWTLLLSWMPIIGDPLTVAAGVLRESFVVFVLLVTIAKFGRYLVLTAATLTWLS